MVAVRLLETELQLAVQEFQKCIPTTFKKF
jgi:hypothetical protein